MGSIFVSPFSFYWWNNAKCDELVAAHIKFVAGNPSVPAVNDVEDETIFKQLS